MSTPPMVRPVGTGALWDTSRHALGICRRVCNTARYNIARSALPDGRQSLETAIENAVAAVVMRHGNLRVGIAHEHTKTPYFTFVPTIDLRSMITWKALGGKAEDHYEALLRSLERTHDTLWPDLATRPGWEVITHHVSDMATMDLDPIKLDITFAFHHAHLDGVASKLFHRDLLAALNGQTAPPEELKGHVLHLGTAPELMPGQEDLIPFKISWPYLIRTIWSEIVYQNLIPAWLKRSPPPGSSPWTARDIALEPHKCNLRLVSIPNKTLAAVLQACRAHNTTLTPFLNSLYAVSLAKRLPAEAVTAFSTVTPIDLRRYAKKQYDVQNNMVAVVSSQEGVFDQETLMRFRSGNVDDTEAFIWATAATQAARLRHKVSTLPNDDIVGMMDWVSDWEKFWQDKIGKKRGSTWEISNIGSLKAEGRGGDWSVDRCLMTQGALPTGSAFTTSVSSVEGGPLCLTLSWQEGILEAELMDGLKADLEHWLGALGHGAGFAIAGRS